MQRLSGLDAAFLALESPTNHLHVVGVIIVDPSGAPGGFDAARLRSHVESRLDRLPPLRRRLATVPFGLNSPLWIEDPDFDLDFHFRRIALPAPGGPSELAALTADLASRPLDRDRPLWEMWYVEGLEHGHVAVVVKVHHSAIDGTSGVELLAELVDVEPLSPAVAGSTDWVADHVPNDAELLGHAVASLALHPVRVVQTLQRFGAAAVRTVRRVRSEQIDAAVPLNGPRLPWNGMLTPHRRVALTSVPLADVKEVKAAFGVTVNDVVMAVCAGALRTYLLARGELPDEPLVAGIPLSVRADDERGTNGNRVSAMLGALPVEVEDPLERLEAVHRSTLAGKAVHEEIGGETLSDMAGLAPPVMLQGAAWLLQTLRLFDRGRPPVSLVVSNVPGPSFPLYLAGARVVALHPFGPIIDGVGLNVTVLSYLDDVGFGFLAARELVPDLDALAAAVPDELRALLKVARGDAD